MDIITRRNFLRTSLGLLASSLAIRLPNAFADAVSGMALDASCDVLVVGGSLGGVAAALAAARMGRRVILTEETDWIGGQATGQGVPLDEHPWIESRGRTASYAAFRTGVRDYYRQHYPLSAAAKGDPHLNPGAGWVSACCFEPRVGLTVLYQMLAPYLASGLLTIHTRMRPTSITMDGAHCRAVTFSDLRGGATPTIEARYMLDATDLGELLPLAKMEFVTGAESRSETQEPTAHEGPTEPLQMQHCTHLIALDYVPGKDYTIDKPSDYDHRRFPVVGIAEGGDTEVSRRNYLRKGRLFAPPSPEAYSCSLWNFRRSLCATNFQPGAFTSDITMLMDMNESKGGPLIGVPPEAVETNLRSARQLTLNALYFLQTAVEPGYGGKPGYPGIRPRGDVFGTSDGLAPFPYIRESRRIKADFTVCEQDFHIDLHPKGPVIYNDSVGVGGYRIDIHESGSTGSGRTQELNGKHWSQQIPLGALIPVRVENLLPACKNLGTTHITNGAFRVHSTEWNIGEAAGSVAAFCLVRNVSPRQVRSTPALLTDLQHSLTNAGVELAWDPPVIGQSYNSHYGNKAGWYFGEANLLKPKPV